MMLETFTIRPADDFRIRGSNRWVSATVQKKLVSKVSRRISIGRELVGLVPGTKLLAEALSFQTPALLNQDIELSVATFENVKSFGMSGCVGHVEANRIRLNALF